MRRSLLSVVLLTLSMGTGCSRSGVQYTPPVRTPSVQQTPPIMTNLPPENVVPAKEGLVFYYQGVNGYAGAWWATAVYADGQILSTADKGLRSGRITVEQVDLLANAAAMAIHGVGKAQDCNATDLSEETFRLRTKGEELFTTVYGLGCGSTDQLKHLAAFRDALSTIQEKATEPYTPPTVLVWVGKTGGPEPNPLPPKWPLREHPPSIFPASNHLELPGDLASVLAKGGASRAVYEYEGQAYWLQWRPVLPGTR